MGKVVESSNPVLKFKKETLIGQSSSSDVACGESSSTTNVDKFSGMPDWFFSYYSFDFCKL